MSQTTTPSGAESNSRAAFEHFMSNAGANPEAIERAFYTYKQAKSANYFHVWSYCWSVREETVVALIARNAELEAERNKLERLCDATYVQQGADAYHHACEAMEAWQEERIEAGKDPGCEGSLCDGLSWLQSRVDQLEAENVDMEKTLSIIAGIAPALGKKSRVRGALTHATSAAAAQLEALARTAAKGNDDG